MKKRLTALVLFLVTLAVGLQPAAAQVASPQLTKKDAERVKKVKKDLTRIGVGSTITVSRKDNRDFFGRVKSIGENDFEVTETDSKIVQIFNYADIKNVRSGDGSRDYFGGQRENPRSRWIIAGAVVGAIILVPVIILASVKD